MAVKPKRPIKTKAVFILLGLLGVLFLALPTAIVLSVGLMPTLVALIVDVTRQRYLTKCVAGMNFAGVLPFLHRLITTGHDVPTAMNIVSDPFVWLVMYAGAAMGWMLFSALPGVVSMFKVLTAKRRVYVLQETQRSLLNEWGDCILPNYKATQGDTESAESTTPPDADPNQGSTPHPSPAAS